MRELPDLPYKVETNARGQLILSPPPSPAHGNLQARVITKLNELMAEGGVTSGEAGVETPEGVLAPDVVWVSHERNEKAREATAYPVAPEICVEILSPSNTDREMQEKRRAYLEAGADEVWIVTEAGAVQFFTAEGERKASRFVPGFPGSI